jgi:hypothetical protein
MHAVIPSPEARKNMMKLAQRMIRTFCINISTSSGLIWSALSDSPDDTVQINGRELLVARLALEDTARRAGENVH